MKMNLVRVLLLGAFLFPMGLMVGCNNSTSGPEVKDAKADPKAQINKPGAPPPMPKPGKDWPKQ